ncbi:TIM44-like domain-containing protein [uncultured Piscinibacter sp.]|uniref:TIM44-like domain-containing protein n=1 Tax=uncultured Piscinibacter sp. TaxID=1131835 RepID=UPI0026250DC4|nr:TIM44-like domain-containing protein [uncultured Piscinibacter sp.]
MLRRSAGPGLMAGSAPVLSIVLALLPHDASAAAMTALSTSMGLAGALLALLASLGASPANAATALGLSVLLLLLLGAATQLRAQGAGLPKLVGRPSRPMLARAVRTEDERALLGAAREQFLRLQAAWDAADLDALRQLTTESMFDEIVAELPARGPMPNRTDVLSLEAHLISHEAVGPLELASIEFSGVVRESADRGAMPFREVWMLAKQPQDGDWRLARQQALL